MSKSRFIALVTSAYVCGVMRHPSEGVLHLEEAEAQRLLDNKSGTDVTDDFTADDRKNTPVMSLDAHNSAAQAAISMAGDAVPHQSEISSPAATETEAPPADAKAKTAKEKAE